jgi:hypothetical protein
MLAVASAGAVAMTPDSIALTARSPSIMSAAVAPGRACSSPKLG